MIVYLAILLFLFYIIFLNKIFNELKVDKREKIDSIAYWLVVGGIIVFSGIRFNIGWDYMAYYETIVDNRETNIILNGEWLSILLINLVKLLDDYRIYFVLNSFLTIFLIAVAIKRYSYNYWISIVIFITFPLFFLNSLSIIRFFVAVAIVFYAFRFLVSGKKVKYVSSVVIATLFHKTALIALVFIILRRINLSKRQIIILLLSIPILKMFFILFVENFFYSYTVYLQKGALEGVQYLGFFLIISLLIIIYKDKLEYNDPVAKIAINLFLFGTMIYLMFVDFGVLGHRLSLYGTMFSLIVIPKILNLFKGVGKFIVAAILICFCIVMFLYTIIAGAETYLPYKTIFFNN